MGTMLEKRRSKVYSTCDKYRKDILASYTNSRRRLNALYDKQPRIITDYDDGLSFCFVAKTGEHRDTITKTMVYLGLFTNRGLRVVTFCAPSSLVSLVIITVIDNPFPLFCNPSRWPLIPVSIQWMVMAY